VPSWGASCNPFKLYLPRLTALDFLCRREMAKWTKSNLHAHNWTWKAWQMLSAYDFRCCGNCWNVAEFSSESASRSNILWSSNLILTVLPNSCNHKAIGSMWSIIKFMPSAVHGLRGSTFTTAPNNSKASFFHSARQQLVTLRSSTPSPKACLSARFR